MAVVDKEQRSFQRIRAQVPLKMELGGKVIDAFTVDISGDGAGITLSQDPGTVKRVGLRFCPAKGKVFSMDGTVRWTRKLSENIWHVGINLINPSLFSLSQVVAA